MHIWRQLSARPMVTLPATGRLCPLAVTNLYCLVNIHANNLRKVATWKWKCRESNPQALGCKPNSLTITPPGDTKVNTFRYALGQWDEEGESVIGDLRYVRRCKETNDALVPVMSHRQQTTDGLWVWLAEVAVPRVGVLYGLLTSGAGQPTYARHTVHSDIHNTQPSAALHNHTLPVRCN